MGLFIKFEIFVKIDLTIFFVLGLLIDIFYRVQKEKGSAVDSYTC